MMPTPATWLTQAQATLRQLEQLNPTDTSQATLLSLEAATQHLAQLGSQLREFTPAQRQQLASHMQLLQSRLAQVVSHLSQGKQTATGQLQTLQQRGHALHAYLVSSFKK